MQISHLLYSVVFFLVVSTAVLINVFSWRGRKDGFVPASNCTGLKPTTISSLISSRFVLMLNCMGLKRPTSHAFCTQVKLHGSQTPNRLDPLHGLWRVLWLPRFGLVLLWRLSKPHLWDAKSPRVLRMLCLCFLFLFLLDKKFANSKVLCFVYL